ncbi:MAG TPA: SprT family zinc-dependent metalloprotease [Thermoleophilia bacterium]|nr:SprT family zinc-dependent metalloprotease [Thermoleophilia bacterium]
MRFRPAPLDTLTIDDLTFAVRWSRRRRTIGLTVGRDGALRVLAPAGVPARKLESVVRAKLPWVRRKLAEFEALGPPPASRRFVDGERLPYLGRSYALALVDRPRGAGAPFALRRGRFELVRGLDGEARAAAVAWYTARAQALIGARVRHYVPLVGASPNAVVVRDLGKRRWGVCDSRTRTVSFHWELVLLSPGLIDYVVVHELAHLHEPNHGRGFWRRVQQVMPDWRAHRARLAARGPRHVV